MNSCAGLDVSVVAWLKDIRYFAELECSTILLAKSILPSTSKKAHKFGGNSSSIKDGRNSDCCMRKAGSEAELIIGIGSGGGLRDPEPELSSNDARCSLDEYDFTEFNETFKETNCSRSSMQRRNAKSLGHLVLLNPEQERDLRNVIESNGGTLLKSTTKYSRDDSSLDSACGSSPVFSSGESPVRTNSPIVDERAPHTSFRDHMDFITLPSYSNAKSSIERILSCSNRIIASFSCKVNSNDHQVQKRNSLTGEILDLVNILENNLILLMDFKEVEKTKQCLFAFEQHSTDDELRELEMQTKKLVSKVHVQLAKVVVDFLRQCRISDEHVHDALNHLAHLALFNRCVCIEAVQCGAVNYLTRILKTNSSSNVRRLALRALSVLCSVSKGCIQLFSVGGLELIARLLHSSNVRCSIEAAGVLTQLTAPSHSFATWPLSLSRIVVRLLELCERAESANSFLLCSAALANLSMQHTSVVELLYKYNAVNKFCRCYVKIAHTSIFAQDQIATVFARMSANGYERALVTQGAVPCLLSLLQIKNHQHFDLAKKIRSKAAVCVGTLGASSFGLQAIHENDGLAALRRAVKVEMQCDRQNPVITICNSVLGNLLKKYRQESAV